MGRWGGRGEGGKACVVKLVVPTLPFSGGNLLGKSVKISMATKVNMLITDKLL